MEMMASSLQIPVTPFQPPKPLQADSNYWVPQTRAQKMALDCKADILLMGGAAGSLKTATLLADCVQDHDLRKMRGVIFRKSYPELDEIISQAFEIYPHLGGIYNDSKHVWRFPAGGTVKFRYIEREKQKYRYQGQQFSTIGFDESTHQEEGIIRYLLTRARSTDPNLKIRMRLASNPGNIGHHWHKELFLHDVCAHCHPGEGAVPGKLYYDRWWPSDKVPLSDKITGLTLSTAFIPGHLSDHNLLGVRYQQLLKTQNPATAKALLAGCWEIFEGQYFKMWEPNRKGLPMVQHLNDIGYQWWWPHWVSGDYGFTISQAFAYLFTRRPPYQETWIDPKGQPRIRSWPNGRIYVLSEYSAAGLKAVDWTKAIVKKWVLDAKGNQLERRFHGWFLSPDSFRRIGVSGIDDLHTLSAQMNKVLEPYGFAWQAAADDRVGGAQLCYSLLDSGEMVILERCKTLVKTIPTRVHDEDHEDDVLKVVGDKTGMDDSYDGWRYGVYSPQFMEDKPAAMRIQELMETATDPTSKMIRARQAEAIIHEEEDDVVAYGGKTLRDRLARNARKKNPWRTPSE
jgi:hypothetical protein